MWERPPSLEEAPPSPPPLPRKKTRPVFWIRGVLQLWGIGGGNKRNPLFLKMNRFCARIMARRRVGVWARPIWERRALYSLRLRNVIYNQQVVATGSIAKCKRCSDPIWQMCVRCHKRLGIKRVRQLYWTSRKKKKETQRCEVARGGNWADLRAGKWAQMQHGDKLGISWPRTWSVHMYCGVLYNVKEEMGTMI